jgi:hypothetical protein
MRWRALRFMTCNSILATKFGVPMYPGDFLIEAKVDTKARIGVKIAPIEPV